MQNYNKLVRDKIPEILDAKKVSYEKRIATPEKYKVELIKKLSEEAKEFLEAESIEELADVLEVVEALKKLPEYKDVEEVRQNKKEERGAFDNKIILKGSYPVSYKIIMKKILILIGVLVILSFIPIFNGTSFYTGACVGADCSNGPFVNKVNFWEYVLVR